MEQGNFSNVKGVGAGVYEYRIDFGPGYRIYFGNAVNDPVLPLTSPLVNLSTYSALTRAARSSNRECR